jgi:uncharacterized membrane protein YfbV (UPF0208 family)
VPPSPPPPPTPDGTNATPSVFTAVVVVELIAIAGLYWLGRHFG